MPSNNGSKKNSKPLPSKPPSFLPLSLFFAPALLFLLAFFLSKQIIPDLTDIPVSMEVFAVTCEGGF